MISFSEISIYNNFPREIEVSMGSKSNYITNQCQIANYAIISAMTKGPERTEEMLEVRFVIAEEILLAQLSTQTDTVAVVSTETGSDQLPAITLVQSNDGKFSIALRADRSWLVTVRGQTEAFENARVKNILLAYAAITDPGFITRLPHHHFMDYPNTRIQEWGLHLAADGYIRNNAQSLFEGLVQTMEQRASDILIK